MKKLKRRKKRKKLIIVLLSVFIILFFIIFVFIKTRVNPIIVDVSKMQINLQTNQILNNAITSSYLKHNTQQFVYVDKNQAGEITNLKTNANAVNLLCNSIVDECNSSFKKLGEEGVSVPTGALLGIPIFASLGPNITFKFVPVGKIDYSYETVLESSGINQTLHKVYITIDATVKLVFGSENPTINVSHTLLVGETLVFGKIPEYMFNRF